MRKVINLNSFSISDHQMMTTFSHLLFFFCLRQECGKALWYHFNVWQTKFPPSKTKAEDLIFLLKRLKGWNVLHLFTKETIGHKTSSTHLSSKVEIILSQRRPIALSKTGPVFHSERVRILKDCCKKSVL